MDIFAQKKFMIWTIALLVLLNILSMAALWYHRSGLPPQTPRQADQRQESVTQFLNRELQLTEGQKKEFDRLRREHVEASTKLNKEIRDAKTALFDLVSASAPGKATIEKLTGEIGVKQAQLDLLLFNHLTTLRNNCTPAQQEKFNTILRDIRALMRPQSQGGERPPRPRDSGQEARQLRPNQQKPARDQNDQKKPPRQGRKDEGRQRPRQQQ
jgi:Spy/CpxP family protein refolding chaperone